MKIELVKYGEMLVSRPAGRDAYLSAKAYLLSQLQEGEIIEVDFAHVDVLTPSWADEFITPLKTLYGSERVHLLNTTNPSVAASLETIEKYR